jgi:O-antigen ligase
MLVEITALRERVSSAERLLAGSGSFSNPNDLAFYLLFSFPGCLLLILEGKPFSFRRLFGLVSAVLVFLFAFQTGSRMALIMMIAVLAFLILTASFLNKAKILVAAIAVGVIAFATGGPGTILRYRTMFEDVAPQGADSVEVGRAVGSTRARKNLLKASLILTMQNPLLGVGPGMFNVAASEDPYTARVLFAAWHETHNTFTQVSSETGIPGFLLYLGTMASCFYIAIRVYRDTKHRPGMELHRKLAYCLLVACINYAVGAMFGSSAYNFFLPTLAGLCAALYRCYRIDLASLSVSQVPPQEPALGFSRSKPAFESRARSWRYRWNSRNSKSLLETIPCAQMISLRSWFGSLSIATTTGT